MHIKEVFRDVKAEVTDKQYFIRRYARLLKLALESEKEKVIRPEKAYADAEKYFARTHPALQALSVKQRRETLSFFRSR